MGRKFFVVTNCTARKKAGIPLVQFLPRGEGIRQIAEHWRSSLEAESIRLQAGQLYVGRSILEAKNVSRELGAQLFIVSAGIGLVNSDETIPGYDISASGNGTELATTLTRHGFSKWDWWHILAAGKGLGWLLREHPDAMLLLSLPSEYLDMVREDLSAVSPCELSRVRVFTSSAGRKKIGEMPGLPVLPYDERLESIAGYAGTRSDFPQRALKHFVSRLKGHLLPIDEATRAVNAALGDFELKASPNRRRLADKEIRELIRQAWEGFGGNSVKLLRHLRDKERVACEQTRFSRLRRQVEEAAREARTQRESRS